MTLSDPNLVTDKECEEFIIVRGKGRICETDNQIVGFRLLPRYHHPNNFKVAQLQNVQITRNIITGHKRPEAGFAPEF